jgi:hypothetical protein
MWLMGKRRYNPLANLQGFVNLTNKKRKTAKPEAPSGSNKPVGKENSEKGNYDVSSKLICWIVLNVVTQMAIGSPEGRLSPASFRSYQSAMEGLESEVEPGSQDDDEDHDDAGPIDDSDSEQSDSEPEKPRRRGTFLPAPTLEQVEDAAWDLQDILKPPRTDTTRPFKDPSLDKKNPESVLKICEPSVWILSV